MSRGEERGRWLRDRARWGASTSRSSLPRARQGGSSGQPTLLSRENFAATSVAVCQLPRANYRGAGRTPGDVPGFCRLRDDYCGRFRCPPPPPPPPRRIPQRAFAVWRRARDGKATGGLSAAAATISTVMSSVVLAIPSVVTAFPAKRLPHIAEVLSM